MNEVKRYHVTEVGLVEGSALGRINVVLGSDYDQLTCKVGNMVCAKRQMDEELEIARDDLVIFKGALSALGEASKKLVVCARTTGGTAGPDQGLMDACAGVEGVITLAGVARAMNEFERVTAERDALQLLLNDRDEQLHTLEQSRRAHLDNGVAAERRVGNLETELKVTKQSLSSLKGERDELIASTAQCQFPQSCTTRCDCDIPDFSPGNGNKARRRVAALEALRPENQRVTPVEPMISTTAYDGFDNGSD